MGDWAHKWPIPIVAGWCYAPTQLCSHIPMMPCHIGNGLSSPILTCLRDWARGVPSNLSCAFWCLQSPLPMLPSKFPAVAILFCVITLLCLSTYTTSHQELATCQAGLALHQLCCLHPINRHLCHLYQPNPTQLHLQAGCHKHQVMQFLCLAGGRCCKQQATQIRSWIHEQVSPSTASQLPILFSAIVLPLQTLSANTHFEQLPTVVVNNAQVQSAPNAGNHCHSVVPCGAPLPPQPSYSAACCNTANFKCNRLFHKSTCQHGLTVDM